MAKRVLLAILLLWTAWVQAAVIEPTKANLFPTEDGYALSADFAIDLGIYVEDVVAHGVPLYFNLELEVNRPRNYWIDEHILSYTLTYRLSYHALTRQYRLSTGALQRNFDTLPEALRAMSRIVALPVTGKNTFRLGENYEAAIRLSLDRGQLPKPFQLDALASRGWQMDSKTLNWKMTVGDGK